MFKNKFKVIPLFFNWNYICNKPNKNTDYNMLRKEKKSTVCYEMGSVRGNIENFTRPCNEK